MRIFLAAPFTAMLRTRGRKTSLKTSYRNFIRDSIVGLRSRGHEVFSAHEREAWGSRILEPEKVIKYDFKGIDEADLVLALIGNPPSPGVQMELGYAAARWKRIILVHEQPFDELPHLTKGLTAFPQNRSVEIRKFSDWFDAIAPHLRET